MHLVYVFGSFNYRDAISVFLKKKVLSQYHTIYIGYWMTIKLLFNRFIVCSFLLVEIMHIYLPCCCLLFVVVAIKLYHLTTFHVLPRKNTFCEIREIINHMVERWKKRFFLNKLDFSFSHHLVCFILQLGIL